MNGCQTTRTIWEVCQQRLEAGGTGTNSALEDWRERAGHGVVVTKVVKVGVDGEDLLQAITRYTNTQNAIRERDFLALTSDFKTWANQMAGRYGVSWKSSAAVGSRGARFSAKTLRSRSSPSTPTHSTCLRYTAAAGWARRVRPTGGTRRSYLTATSSAAL